jgi:hypothetical protein
LCILLAGCLLPNYELVEDLGGKYDAKLISEEVTTTNGAKVNVLKVLYNYAGEEERGVLPESIIPAFEKIKSKSPEDAVVTMWWDYASALRGYTGREVVIDAPSPQIEYSVAGGWAGDLESNERVRDVATIFTTNSTDEAIQLMRKHSSEFILIHGSDVNKAFVFFNLVGDSGEYIKFLSTGHVIPTEKGEDTLFFRMYFKEEIPGFAQIYADNSTRIYQIEST